MMREPNLLDMVLGVVILAPSIYVMAVLGASAFDAIHHRITEVRAHLRDRRER